MAIMTPTRKPIGNDVVATVIPTEARWGASGVTTSSFAYAWTVMDGTYEIINNSLGTVSAGSVANGTFPSWGTTEAVITADATTVVQVYNTSVNYAASAGTGRWDCTTCTPFGGIGTSGSLFTSAAGEKFFPVASSPNEPNTWIAPNGKEFNEGVFSTGSQQYRIMQQPGPWPAGSGANTSATLPMNFAPIFNDLGLIIDSQGGYSESLTDNWNPGPG